MLKSAPFILTWALVFSAALAAYSGARWHTENVTADSVLCRVLSEEGASEREAMILLPVFASAADELYAEYNTAQPLTFSLTAACGGWIFHSLTGRSAETAALFIPDREEFIFQRPSALSRKGILEKTVRHELMHSIFHFAKGKDPRPFNALQSADEETFCTAVYPVGEHDISSGRRKCAEYGGDDEKIRQYLAAALFSKNAEERKIAAACAYVRGKDLLARYGRKEFFRRAAAL
ncbi:MAG: hypothetical protein ACRCUT_03505 [Spirochaetota bacterium]